MSDAAAPADQIPEGFEPLRGGGRYFSALGTVYQRRTADGGAVLGLRIAPGHLNSQGVAHGGMLTTLADSALGYNLGLRRGRRGAQVTVSISADFLASAREGDWLEAHVTPTRIGRRLAYVSCDLTCGDRHVLRSSAVFAFVERALPPAPPSGEMPLPDG